MATTADACEPGVHDPEGLLKDLLVLYLTKKDYNVTITVHDKEFRAHSQILNARCPYFVNRNKHRESDSREFYKISDTTPELFELVLQYIYTGELLFDKSLDYTGILLLANDLELNELVENLRTSFLNQIDDCIRRVSSQHSEPVSSMVSSQILNDLPRLHKASLQIDQLHKASRLTEKCSTAIPLFADHILSSNNFVNYDEDLVMSVLGRDYLKVNELKVWDTLLRWGAKRSGVGDDRTIWQQEDYERMKPTLQHLIPLVRFDSMTMDDFNAYVRPFAAIFLDRELYRCVELHFSGYPQYLLPARQQQPMSIIATPIEFESICSQLNQHLTASYSRLYRPELLYRGDPQRWAKKTTISKEKSNTIVLLRFQSNVKIGLYNPNQWCRWLGGRTRKYVFEKSWHMKRGVLYFILCNEAVEVGVANNQRQDEQTSNLKVTYYKNRWLDLRVTNDFCNQNGLLPDAHNLQNPEEVEVFKLVRRKMSDQSTTVPVAIGQSEDHSIGGGFRSRSVSASSLPFTTVDIPKLRSDMNPQPMVPFPAVGTPTTGRPNKPTGRPI